MRNNLKFFQMCCRRMTIRCTDCEKSEEELHRVKGERNILYAIERKEGERNA
jgi:hypothetical protein